MVCSASYEFNLVLQGSEIAAMICLLFCSWRLFTGRSYLSGHGFLRACAIIYARTGCEVFLDGYHPVTINIH